jgi:hypothetical protein
VDERLPQILGRCLNIRIGEEDPVSRAVVLDHLCLVDRDVGNTLVELSIG